MIIRVSYRLYNTHGAHRSISLVGDLLEDDMPYMGSAVQEIDITLYFYHGGPARKTLETLQAQFHERLKTLPKCVFYRKKHCIQLEIQATFITGYEIDRQDQISYQINPDWVKSSLLQIIDALPIIQSKIKKTDDFDFLAFQNFVLMKLERLPQSMPDLEKLEAFYTAKKAEEYAQLDEWEKLHIDWDHFHPQARDIVPLPFQWDCLDEFSPHGNDTGADILELFKNWNVKNKHKNGQVFLLKISEKWDISLDEPYHTEDSSLLYFQFIIGLVFASAKIRGYCETELKKLALTAIIYRLKYVTSETHYKHQEECINKLEQIQWVIEAMPTQLK